jgi:hypothetical protein
MSLEKLIIFDYSGTLSLDASLFARPDYLTKQLEESGLKDLGIDSPEIFWRQLVNPTWKEGSTTSAGYKKILENRITAILYQKMSIISCVPISDAVSSFVDHYLSHSRIDRRWGPVLHLLNTHPSVKVIIATDHYAEATNYIIKFMRDFQIHAVAANEASLSPRETSFIVANSADMGVHKADPRFWKMLKFRLNLDAIHKVLIIDDFGHNEQEGDRYSEQRQVAIRKEKTVRMLESVFQADIQVIPFMIEDGDLSQDDIYGNLIKSATTIIEQYVASDSSSLE